MKSLNVAMSLLITMSLLSVSVCNAIAHVTPLGENTEFEASESTNAEATNQAYPLTFEQISINYMNNPALVGEARLKVMFWDIYDAKLTAPSGDWKEDQPYALSLTYLRDFDGEEIASRSIDEMRDLGYQDEVLLAKWFEQMRSVFPDVKEGQNITGVFDQKGHTHFYYEGRHAGSIEDISFGQSFFAIWLHPKTSEPRMRKQLLGLK